MKNLSCLLFLIFIASASAIYSQDSFVGVEGGANFSNMSVDPEPDGSTESRTGLIAGAVWELLYGDNIVVQPSLKYVGKGFSQTDGGVKTSFTIDYLDIPIFFKYKAGFESVDPFLTAGVSMGLVVSAEQETTDSSGTASNDFKESMNSIDMSLLIGGGTDINITESTKFYVQLVYSYGLTDARKSNATDWKNRCLQLSTGVLFRLN